MTAPDPRLEEIKGRANVIRRCMEAHPNDCYDMGDIGPALEAAKGDVAYLLAELRKAQDKLARVEGVAGRLEARALMNDRNTAAGLYDEAMELAADAASSVAREAAAQLRAAVADATGGGE